MQANLIDTIILINTESKSLPIDLINGLNGSLDKIFKAEEDIQEDIRIDECETIFKRGKGIAKTNGVQIRLGITIASQYMFCQISEYKSLLRGSCEIRQDSLSHTTIHAIYFPVSFIYLHLWLPEFGKSQLKFISSRRGSLTEVIIAALNDDPYEATLTLENSVKTFKLREVPIIDKSKDSKPYNIFSDPLPYKKLSKILGSALAGTDDSHFYSWPKTFVNNLNEDSKGSSPYDFSHFF